MHFESLATIVRYNYIFASRSFKELNLGNAEHAVLACLSRMEHANQDAIATCLDIDKGAVAKTLASLEKKQYVIRQENPDNRREKLVTVTPAGEAMNQRMVEMLKAWDDSLLIGLTSEEITQFEAISQKISINAKSFLKEDVKK